MTPLFAQRAVRGTQALAVAAVVVAGLLVLPAAAIAVETPAASTDETGKASVAESTPEHAAIEEIVAEPAASNEHAVPSEDSGDAPAEEVTTELRDDVAVDLSDSDARAAESDLTASTQPTTPAAAASVAAAEVRTISGTIQFDARTTDALRRTVTVSASRIVDGASPIAIDEANIAYDAVTGAYALTNLEPGKYSLAVIMNADGAWFNAAAQPITGWADWPVFRNVEDAERAIVDVTDADRTGFNYFFDSAGGGIDFFVYGDVPSDSTANAAVKVFAINVETGEEAPLTYMGRCGGGYGCAWQGAFISGTKIKLRAETPGITAYYDGGEFGTTNVDEAAVLTADVWAWQSVKINVWPLVSLGDGGANLTDATRREVVSPDAARVGQQITVFAGKKWANWEVDGWLFSDPVHLGAARVGADGYVTFTLPAGISGSHRIALMSNFMGELIGWDNVSIVASDSGGHIGGDGSTGGNTDGNGAASPKPDPSDTTEQEQASALAATGMNPVASALGFAVLLLLAGACIRIASARSKAAA